MNNNKMDHNRENLYEILKISRDASQNDIKDAYKKLALLKHPDKGGDASEFSKIQIAYNTLKDVENKKIYDDNLNFANTSEVITPNKTINITINIYYNWKDMYIDKPLYVEYERDIFCNECKGHGQLTEAFVNIEPCIVCRGQGRLNNFRRGNVKWVVCFHCYGSGLIESNPNFLRMNCKSCNGIGIITVDEKVHIHLEEYIKHEKQHIISFHGKGNANLKQNKYGDLFLKINEVKGIQHNSEDFTRKGFNIHFNKYITYFDCIKGGSMSFIHPLIVNSTKNNIKLPPLIDNDGILQMENLNHTLYDFGFGGKGNIIIDFKIVCPDISDIIVEESLLKICGKTFEI
jgi:DnaJ homolog subfamily A member 2